MIKYGTIDYGPNFSKRISTYDCHVGKHFRILAEFVLSEKPVSQGFFNSLFAL
jgi:hypothetical protein